MRISAAALSLLLPTYTWSFTAHNTLPTTTTTTTTTTTGASHQTISSSSSLFGSNIHDDATTTDCLIIGSGISGSCLAFHLKHNHGIDNLILAERNAVVGGNVISRSNDEGFVWEEGPNSFQPTPAICQTVHELGISDELVLADATLPRFVYWHGQGAGNKLADLHALPTNLPGDLLTFNLLTWPGRIRAALGALGFLAPSPSNYEENVREFVTRHLGEEAFLRIIDPFVSGVYAGDPDELAMAAALKKIHRLEGLGELGPGLISGAIRRFQEMDEEKLASPPDPAWPTYQGGQLGSFRRGLQTLPNAVERYLNCDASNEKTDTNTKAAVRCGWAITKLEHDDSDDGLYRATFDTPDGTKQIKARSVCLTSPTGVTCDIAKDLIPAAARLSEVYAPPVASVTIAYQKKWFKKLPGGTTKEPLRGFGHLIPRSMNVRSLGTIWSSSLFPDRAPKGWHLLLTYIGGARDRGIQDLSEEEIYAQCDADNHAILLKKGAPEGKRVGLRVWQRAIPQYRRGHLQILKELEEDERKAPGLYLGGNYRTGVAFGDCVAFGVNEAKRVADFLNMRDEDASSSSSAKEVVDNNVAV